MWDIPFYCGSASLSTLSNKCGFGHNYALSTQMAGELLSSQRLQLSPIASVLHLNFSCLSRTRIHPITDVWVAHKSQVEGHSLFLSASPHTTKPVWIWFLIMSQLYLLLCHPITCLYCFSSPFNCSQFFQRCLPPIHFLQSSQKDGFKWESDCVLEILRWLATALRLKIKDIHLAFTFQPDFTRYQLFLDGPEPGPVLVPLSAISFPLPSFC